MGEVFGGKIRSRSVMKKVVFAALCCNIVSLWVAVQAFAQAPLQKVTLSYSSSGITSIEFFIAKERKFFQEEGLEPLLIQTSANAAIAAGITGDLNGLSSIGSAIRAIQRGAPLRAVSVSLRRPLFWLVARPEYKSVKELRGKVLGIVTVGGSQYTAARRLIALGGLDPDKEITAIQGGEESRLLQALVSNAIQVSAISPPWVLIGRDKFKMNVLDSAIDKFASIQNGLAVNVKTLREKPDLVKKLLRAKAKAARYFEQHEREVSEMLAKMWNTDVATALESYRLSKPAFTVTGIPTDDEINEYLAIDAQVLKLAQPVAPASVFDFTIQREVNKELGVR
jgi:ABC-type nitrate/sulfonate/bicarbonate transport system substrate-binding protein